MKYNQLVVLGSILCLSNAPIASAQTFTVGGDPSIQRSFAEFSTNLSNQGEMMRHGREASADAAARRYALYAQAAQATEMSGQAMFQNTQQAAALSNASEISPGIQPFGTNVGNGFPNVIGGFGGGFGGFGIPLGTPFPSFGNGFASSSGFTFSGTPNNFTVRNIPGGQRTTRTVRTRTSPTGTTRTATTNAITR